VDLNEAARRILRHHWVLISLLTLVGLSVPLVLESYRGETYVATARISIGTTDTRDGQEANALADTALALATSPEIVRGALEQSSVQRDGADVAGQVRVEPVGTSGVLELSVTDQDAEVSARLANALAAEVVRIREDVVLGGTHQLLAQLDEQIAALDAQIAGAVTPEQSARAAAQRSSLEAQRRQLAQNVAVAVRPRVIDDSTVRGTLVSDPLATRLAVGALFGLVLGVALAATIEALRPTLSRGSLARHLGAPLLGRLSKPPTAGAVVADPWLVGYLELAAESAGVDTIQLVAVDPRTDLAALAHSLSEQSDSGLTVVPLELAASSREGGFAHRRGLTDLGLVVVTPDVVKAPALEGVERHVRLTRVPVIGVITYRGRPKQDRVPLTEVHEGSRHGAPKAAPSAAPVR
jgi:capsular polysaccharide biosynthesis protein